jgi:hypothetical protein
MTSQSIDEWQRDFPTDPVTVPLYNISEPIDWRIKHITDKRWECVSKALFQCEVYHIRKQLSRDGFRV